MPPWPVMGIALLYFFFKTIEGITMIFKYWKYEAKTTE
jgi:hypothetical protein